MIGFKIEKVYISETFREYQLVINIENQNQHKALQKIINFARGLELGDTFIDTELHSLLDQIDKTIRS